MTRIFFDSRYYGVVAVFLPILNGCPADAIVHLEQLVSEFVFHRDPPIRTPAGVFFWIVAFRPIKHFTITSDSGQGNFCDILNTIKYRKL
jgi:hypothetical protein